MLVSDIPPAFLRSVAFIFGALWGSFFNVAIYRWPLGMSVVRPPSHCPSCGHPVAAFRNVPILAYVFQRGRASCCGTKLTPRYLLVELASAVLCLAVVERFVLQNPDAVPLDLGAALALFFFVGGLLVATFIDLEHTIIPDEVTLPGAALGLATVTLHSSGRLTPADAALGAGLGYLIIQLVFVWGYEAAFGRRGMGEGDSKLLMMIGAFCGWKGVLFAILAGCVQGIVVVVFGMLIRQDLTAGDEFAHDPPPHNEDGPRQSTVHSAGAAPVNLVDKLEKAAAPQETAGPQGLTIRRFFVVSVLCFGSAYLTDRVLSDAALADLASAILVAAGVAMLALYLLEGVRARRHKAERDAEISSQHASEHDSHSDEEDLDEVGDAALVPPKIPFGPFLALSALEWLFFGEQIVEWWFSLI